MLLFGRLSAVDVRLIAATSCDLEAAVRTGQIRQDFYYRLNVSRITLPPLRERAGDVALLARHFLRTHAVAYGKAGVQLSAAALWKLEAYPWPGNVRELEHVIMQALSESARQVLRPEDLPLPTSSARSAHSFRESKKAAVKLFEETYMRNLLAAHRGNVTRAAQAAQTHRWAFRQLLDKHHIDPRLFADGAAPPIRLSCL
jgi:DNA-binding NtrC family response regulator